MKIDVRCTWHACMPVKWSFCDVQHCVGAGFDVGLLTLLLDQNRMMGEVPTEIGNFTKLKELNLSKNKFTGELPLTLGNCVKLQKLELLHNLFKGEIPDTLGKCIEMEELGLGINQLTGEVPMSFGNFKKLRRLNLLSIPKLTVTKKVKRAIRIAAPTAKCDWPRLQSS